MYVNFTPLLRAPIGLGGYVMLIGICVILWVFAYKILSACNAFYIRARVYDDPSTPHVDEGAIYRDVADKYVIIGFPVFASAVLLTVILVTRILSVIIG